MATTTELFDEYFKAERRLIRKIAGMISSGKNVPNWDAHMLARYQKVREGLIADLTGANLARAKKMEAEIRKAYESGNLQIMSDLGKTLAPLEVASSVKNAAILRLTSETNQAFDALNSTILRQTDDLFRGMVGQSATDVVIGVLTKPEAAKALLQDFVKNGMTFVDRSGRNWSIESYSDMALRTATSRSMISGHEDSLAANNIDLVIVTPGSRPCSICDRWARKILSRDGSTGTQTVTDYLTGGTTTVTIDATLEEARDQGFQHPNCRCAIGAYLPGVTDPGTIERPPWDKEGYEAQQKQRGFERKIRDAKKELAAATSPDEESAARQRVKDRQKDLRDHLDQNDFLKRRNDREQIATG